MAEVNLKNVSKHYGDVRAVDDVSLNVHDREFVTLVGPSGCGKTTTLHMIAGLIELDGGEIWISEHNVGELDPKDRNIAMVFQNYALYPHKTVYQNLEFPLRMRRMEKAEREKRIQRAAKILHIEPLLERKPRALSGGQQQRVALGRAIVRDPAVFLMDEPLSNLDAKLRVQMRTEIKHLQKQLQATMIYVTHDQMEAMTMSDRIAIMNHGRVQQFGTPDELFNRPANTFVAGFIGNPPMNLIEAEVREEGGLRSIVLGNTTITPRGDRLRGLLGRVRGRQVTLGVRHTALRPASGESPAAIRAQIYTVEPAGDVTYIQVQLGDAIATISTTEQRFQGRIGDNIALDFEEERLYLFDAAEGQALYP